MHCSSNISSSYLNLSVCCCCVYLDTYVHEHACLFRCLCLFSVPLRSPPYENMRDCMSTRPQFLHCMPTCRPVCTWSVFHLSVSIYMHINVCGGDTLLSHPLPLARTDAVKSKREGEGRNSISLVWKLPAGWAQAAGREGGSSRQRRRKTCFHMLISKRKGEMRGCGGGDQERWGRGNHADRASAWEGDTGRWRGEY